MILARSLIRKATAPLRRWVVRVVREQEVVEAERRLNERLAAAWEHRRPTPDVFVDDDQAFADLMTVMRAGPPPRTAPAGWPTDEPGHRHLLAHGLRRHQRHGHHPATRGALAAA